MYDKNILHIIIIQKYLRRYLLNKKFILVQSNYQTKIWRKNRKWYKNGKSNECEKYQKNIIENIINLKILLTHDRLNIENIEIKENKYPLTSIDGYEWTENFDGKIVKEDTYYFNLKFVCDLGGAQTRTLREVYHFIKHQYLSMDIYFLLFQYFQYLIGHELIIFLN